jgi:adenylate kinase family enzyme
MRIGISGVSSTGKSTLAKILSDIYKIPLLNEGMKDVYTRYKEAGKDFPKFSELPDSIKLDFQISMIKHRTQKELEMEEFIGDGTPLDVAAFWLEWISRIEDGPVLKYRDWTDTRKQVDSLIWQGLGRYDVIFRLPFGAIPVEDDNRRIINQDFLRKMSYILEGVTNDHPACPRIVNVTSLSIADRVDEIVMKVSDLLVYA